MPRGISQACGSNRGDEFKFPYKPGGKRVVGRETPELMLCPQAISGSEVNVTEKIEVGLASEIPGLLT